MWCIRVKIGPNIIYGLSDLCFTVVLIIVFYIKYGLRHKPSQEYDYTTELPDDMSPAEINAYLRHNDPDSSAVTSTILDLSIRGFIQFETVLKRPGFFKRGKAVINMRVMKKEDISIKEYERELLCFLDEVYYSGYDIKEYSSMNGMRVHNFFSKWKQLVRESILENYKDYFETLPLRPKIILLTLSTLNVLWIAISSLKKEFTMITPLLSAVIISLCGLSILKRKSQSGIDNEYLWRAFRSFLKEFSKLDRGEIPEISAWECYLVYAEALNVSKQVLKQLPVVFPEIEEKYYISWFNYYGYMYGETSVIESYGGLGYFIETLTKAWIAAFHANGAGREGEGIH